MESDIAAKRIEMNTSQETTATCAVVPLTKHEMLKAISEKIHSVRITLGLSIPQAAKKVELPVSTYRSIEYMRYAPSLWTWKCIKNGFYLNDELDEIVRTLNQEIANQRVENMRGLSGNKWRELPASKSTKPTKSVPSSSQSSKSEMKTTELPPVSKESPRQISEILGPRLTERALLVGLEKLESDLLEDLAKVKEALVLWNSKT